MSYSATYGLRWLIEYKDVNEVLTQVKISEKDYEGASVDVLPGDDPVTILWGDDTDTAPIVYGSAANIRFIAESNFQFIDLFTSDPEKYLVEIVKGSTTIWTGFAVTDQWKEALTEPPYSVTLEATDGLANLREEPWVDDDGDEYTGTMSLQAILTSILDKTRLNLDFNTAIDYHEASQDTDEDTLTQTFIDVSVYREKTCGDILEELFPECRIYQRAGAWWVVSNSNYARTSFTYNRYSYHGVIIEQATCTNAATGWQMEGTPEMEMKPALKFVKINQVYGLKDNLLVNANFDGGLLTGWSYVGNAPTIRTLNDKGQNYIYQYGVEDPANTENMSKCIYQTFRVYATEKNVRLRFRWAPAGLESEGCYMYWKLAVVADSAETYYAARIEGVDKDKTIWRFVTPASGEDQVRPVAYKYDHEINPLFPFYNDYAKKLHGWLLAHVPDHFEQFEAVIEGGFPEDGYMTLKLFVPKNGNPNIYGSCWADISIEFLGEDKTILPTNTTYKITRDARNNEVPDDIEVPHGDLPSAIENGEIAYVGGFKDLLGTPTFAWIRDGDDDTYTWAELIGRLMAARMRIAQQSYRMTINSLTPGTAMVIVDTLNSSRKFVESGIQYNDRLGITEGQWIEVLAVDLAAGISVETVDEHEESRQVNTIPGGGSSAETPATEPGVDEKVAVADEDTGDVTGEAGMLADAYFEKKEITDVDFPVYVPTDLKVLGVQFTGLLQGTYTKLSGALQTIDAIQSLQGTQGAAIQGTQGTQGTQGAAIQGTAGASVQGTQGIQGEAIQGAAGASVQGTQGIQGAAIQGTAGASIQGTQGIQGTAIQGTQGTQGRQGTAGTGTQGTQGTQGAAIQGTAGASVQGTQGIQGEAIQGTAGTSVQGTQGIQGAAIQGTQGTQGRQGTTGTGIQGIQGIQGPTGVGTPGGTSGNLQYNNGGVFAGFGNWNAGTEVMAITGSVAVSSEIYTTTARPIRLFSSGELGFTNTTAPSAPAASKGLLYISGTAGSEKIYFKTNTQTFDLTAAAVQGTQGIQGAAGTGTQGTQGTQGAAIQGTAGVSVQGTQGIQGAAIQGTQGIQGRQGTQGTLVQGTQGAAGNSVQGTQGTQGILGTGTQGTQGIQGTKGIDGSNGSGLSCYQTSIANSSYAEYTVARIDATDKASPSFVAIVIASSTGVAYGTWAGVVFGHYNNGSPTASSSTIVNSPGSGITITTEITSSVWVTVKVTNNSGSAIFAAFEIAWFNP